MEVTIKIKKVKDYVPHIESIEIEGLGLFKYKKDHGGPFLEGEKFDMNCDDNIMNIMNIIAQFFQDLKKSMTLK